MARITTPRAPAAPSGDGQRARRAAMLRSAARLGARRGFEQVQMQDVARDAGVALGTLYRYFPSKADLFLALMGDLVFGPEWGTGAPESTGSVEDLLLAWASRFFREPALGRAMIRSSLMSYGQATPAAAAMDERLVPLLLGRLGIEDPSAEDLGRLRLLLYSWWGVVTARLAEHLSAGTAEQHIRQSVSLMLPTPARAVAEPEKV